MSDFYLQACSDLDYEKMVIDICNDQTRIATLHCDNGLENARIVIYDQYSSKQL